MKLISLFFLAVCVVLATASQSFQDAKEGQFPYQVSLRYKTTKKHFCGGAILNSRFIITAGHCTRGNRNVKKIYAIVGALYSTKGGVRIALDRAAEYNPRVPNWDPACNQEIQETYDMDLGLIRTAKNIQFSSLVQPIALPTRNTIMEENVQAVISGFEPENIPSNRVLKFMETRTMNYDLCFKKFEEKFPYCDCFRGMNMCTNQTLYYEFEGSPLVDVSNPEKKELMGIASFGAMCDKDYPEVYSRVFTFLDWIVPVMERLSKE